MKIPLSWLKTAVLLDAKIGNAEIESAFIRAGFEVEEVLRTGGDIRGPLKVARVESIEELAGHKKPIRYVGVDCGEGSTRFIVCGAQNFKVGDFVVVSLPGAVLPGNFEIAARETYGKTSNGMICSARELGMGEDHAGIIVLPRSSEVKEGVDALSILELDDVIFDISVNPDRGYAMSLRGLARELAMALNTTFTDPVLAITDSFEINGNGIQVKISDTSACDVIYIRTIKDFDLNASTPLWMRRRIEKCGMRSISLAVDITNYVMLELGQPLHAFDADKISGSINIRRAGNDKELKTLDGVVRKLNESDLVVADEKSPQALAGTMGGASSEISGATSKIALEAARFNPKSIAQNSRKHILSSEASRRLERGVDPVLAKIASARAIDLMISLGAATYVGTATAGNEIFPEEVDLDPQSIPKLLGIIIKNEEIKRMLELIGCKISTNNEKWNITPPSWRPDLIHFSDFAEEIARILGYDSLPQTLPIGKSGAELTGLQKRKRFVSNYLANLGFSEVYNYPFINQDYLESLGFKGDRAKTFKIVNPMSEDYPVLRTHLLPGMFQTALRNMGRGQKDIAIFEIGAIFRNVNEGKMTPEISTHKRPTPAEIEAIYQSVPKQPVLMCGLVAGKLHSDGWQGSGEVFDWSDAIGITAAILDSLGQSYELVESDFAPWHPGRCAEFRINGKAIAHAGEIHPRVISKLDLPERSCAFGILLSEFPESEIYRSKPINAMTPVIQDLALVVDKKIHVSEVVAAIKTGAGDLLESISLFDRYDKIGEGKVSLAFTLTFRASDRTLTTEEVSIHREAAIAAAHKSCGAELRS